MIPAHVYLVTAVFGLVFGFVIAHMIMYAPGQRQAEKALNKMQRRTRAHHHKLGDGRRH